MSLNNTCRRLQNTLPDSEKMIFRQRQELKGLGNLICGGRKALMSRNSTYRHRQNVSPLSQNLICGGTKR